MNAIGNIFLTVAALVFFAMFNMMFLKATPRGDAAVGYVWSLLLGTAVFSICLAAATAVIGWQGGFAWIGGSRTTWAVGGFLLIMLGNGFFTLMSGEPMGELPGILRLVLRSIPAVLPPLLIMSAAILLNAERTTAPAVLYKWPIFIGLAAGGLTVLFLIVQSTRQTSAIRIAKREYVDKIHQDHLNHIDTTDVAKDMVFLLVYTDANQAAEVRERALAKIKSRPDWQEELVRRLQNDWAPEAFTFLASNEVDDQNLFPEAVRQGVLIQARLIRECIRGSNDSYSLYPGRFTWEVERVLRTVNQFRGMGVDYRPAIKELRHALDEPTSFQKPKLEAAAMVEKWLKQY